MRLKSFYAANSTEAMRLVREALGDNAIIVATRDDDGGVRVTAAIDDPVAPPAAPTLAQKAAEMAEDESIETIAQSFVRHQVPNTLSERLLATATQYASEDALLAMGAALDTHFKFQPLSEDLSQPLILIGPPGAGKTLCAAKLATKAALGKTPIALVSTDTERAGGMAQLGAFARLLKTDLLEIEDAHALRDALLMQKPDTTTLVDTAGCNPFSASDRDNLAALIRSSGAYPVLVLPADLDSSEALDMAKEFAAIGAKTILPTRLDMTRRLGGLLRVAYESKLPLSNFSASSKVTEAPQPLNPVSLARLILPVPKQVEQKATGTNL